MTKPSFVHLHTHTDYSLLDGAAQLGPLMEAAVREGMPAIAITDHGNLHGAFDFYKQAHAHGIKPIIGLEAYMVPGTNPRSTKAPILFSAGGEDDVSAKGAYTHMTLLAETTAGMHNLFRLSTQSYIEGFYKKPRADRELLSQYGEGLIGTTGCPGGEVQTYLRLGMYDRARQAAADYRDILGPANYYAELMDHGIDVERRVKDDLLRLAKGLGLPLLATNDVHYVNKADATAHAALLCVNSRTTLNDPNRFKFDADTFHLRTPDEMRLVFANHAEACDNTLLIAERCEVTFHEGANLMPEFDVPEGETEDTWFTQEVQRGLARRYPDGISPAAQARADYEVSVISKMGFSGYYLVVADFIHWARDQGIRVGPGRGSGAGSIAAYALRITELDPLEHDLLFERFLNPDRVSPPDFDIDFDERRRGEVITYVTNKYGADRVAQIVTMQTIKAKAAIKDSVRVHGLPYSLSDQATKAYPGAIMGATMPLSAVHEPKHDRYTEAADFRSFLQTHPEMGPVMDTARGIESIKRGTGVHAAGIIMSKARLADHIPMMMRPDDGAIITQFENQWCETLGLLKMDFLGLSNLTIIDDAIVNIRTNQGVEVDLDALPLDDADTYRTLAGGHGVGVFQCESAGISSLLRQIAPTHFRHLDATLALYRPGPMGANAHIDYANRKNGRAPVTPIHPELADPLKDVLSPTYGLIVYQEQVMAIAQKLAGYSLAQADLLRRAMGKKKKEILDKEFVPFRDGMLANGYSQKAIDTLWEILVPFSGYAFNKSHTAAYGLISYWTAWLKTNYPVEYMAALLTGADDRAEAAKFLSETRRMKIRIAVPDVNQSGTNYTAVGDTIRVGLSAIVNVSAATADAIVAERTRNGPYKDFLDFVDRVDQNSAKRNTIESLIKAGAFDSTGHTRNALLSVAGDALAAAAAIKKARQIGQDDLFGAVGGDAGGATLQVPDLPEYETKVLLGLEREQIGLYVSDHPLRPVAANLSNLASSSLADLHNSTETSHQVTIAGGIARIERKTSKKGQPWAVIHVEDLDTDIEVLCFPNTYMVVAEHLVLDQVVVVTGKVDREEDGTAKVVADTVTVPDLDAEGNRPLYLTVPRLAVTPLNVTRIKEVAHRHPGHRPLRLRLANEDGTVDVYQLDRGLAVTFDDASASEFKEYFGAGCLDQPA